MPIQTTYNDLPAIAHEGQLAAPHPDVMPMTNGEASASIAFGHAVKWKGSTSDQHALLPSVETDKIAGIVVKSDAYQRVHTLPDGSIAGELDGTGLKPGAMLNVLRKGVIWVVAEDGCVPGDRLWVRAVAGAPPEYLGGLNNADDSTDMVDCTAQGVWLTTAVAGGLAKLEVDFTNKPA